MKHPNIIQMNVDIFLFSLPKVEAIQTVSDVPTCLKLQRGETVFKQRNHGNILKPIWVRMNKPGIEIVVFTCCCKKGMWLCYLARGSELRVLVVKGCCASPATKAPRKFTNETRESGWGNMSTMTRPWKLWEICWKFKGNMPRVTGFCALSVRMSWISSLATSVATWQTSETRGEVAVSEKNSKIEVKKKNKEMNYMNNIIYVYIYINNIHMMYMYI